MDRICGRVWLPEKMSAEEVSVAGSGVDVAIVTVCAPMADDDECLLY
jgi:hypothetical protein